MARKIGFGGDEQPKAHSPSTHADVSAPPPPSVARDRPRLPLSQRIFLSLALTVWLAGWTVAISFAASALLESLGETGSFQTSFLAIWIMIAAVAWVFAARSLLRVLRGRPIGRDRRKRSARGRVGANWTRDDLPDER